MWCWVESFRGPGLKMFFFFKLWNSEIRNILAIFMWTWVKSPVHLAVAAMLDSESYSLRHRWMHMGLWNSQSKFLGVQKSCLSQVDLNQVPNALGSGSHVGLESYSDTDGWGLWNSDSKFLGVKNHEICTQFSSFYVDSSRVLFLNLDSKCFSGDYEIHTQISHFHVDLSQVPDVLTWVKSPMHLAMVARNVFFCFVLF